MKRILLADHHAHVLWGLKTMLQEDMRVALVGEAADAESLIELSQKNHPDLILMDRNLPGDTIENLITTLHRLVPKPVVIMMSDNPEDNRILLQAGADAIVSKSETAKWLAESLEKYLRGGNPTKSPNQ